MLTPSRYTMIFASAIVILISGLLPSAGAEAANPPDYERSTTPATALTEVEVTSLLEALDNEYYSWAVYNQVIEDFGTRSPFTNIRRAEINHINAVKNLLELYGIPVPTNPWLSDVPHFNTIKDACIAGARDEAEQGPLYDRLLTSTTRTNILSVYTRLQRTSITQHLAAFERCSR